MERHAIKYKDKIIEFELHRKNVKNINLNVKPNMTIMVSANDKVPLEYILDFVTNKAPWILKNISYFKEAQPENEVQKEYVSGESFKYLGKQYRLQVEAAEKDEVKYKRGYIYLFVKDSSNKKRKAKIVKRWLRGKAVLNFNASLEKVYPLVEKYGVKKPNIIIRSMKARWGSCLKDKDTIILNYELIKAPKYCIEYVILHELIHFKYGNHDDQFISFLTVLMPDWKERKSILDQEVVRGL